MNKGYINRLIDTSEHILRLLSKSDTNVNQIIKQTSSDRTYVINVIKTLQQEGLISERIEGKLKKKIQSLTELGREVAEIIKSVQSCYELCDDLKHNCGKHDYALNFMGVRTKTSPLKYSVHMLPESENKIGIAFLNYTAADYVRDFVVFKYLLLSGKYNADARKKKITSQILEQIISDATRRQMDAIMKGIVWIGDPSELIADFGEHVTKIANLPEKMRRYGLLSNKFSCKEKAKEALLSVLPLLKSERKSILEKLDYAISRDEEWRHRMQEKLDRIGLNAGWSKDKPHRKEDPSELEVKMLYKEIRKALS